MSRQPDDSHAVMTRDADHFQAEYFDEELHRQIELLNERAEVLRQALAAYVRRGEVAQARRMQRELRDCAVERRKLFEMLSALNRRFGRDETQTQPATTNSRPRMPKPPASHKRTTQRRAVNAPA